MRPRGTHLHRTAISDSRSYFDRFSPWLCRMRVTFVGLAIGCGRAYRLPVPAQPVQAAGEYMDHGHQILHPFRLR